MRRLMLCAGIAAVALLGQCPDIEFFSARTVITTDLSSQTAIGVLYLHPGKFVAGRYNLFSPNKLMEVIPNYQRHMVNCFQKKSFDTVTPSAKDYSAGAGSQLALAADLDNNELFGVIWLGYQRSSVQVHLVKMLGLAVGTQSYTVGMNAASALFADVNGDGFDDLLVVNAGTFSASSIGSVSVLLGNGDGTFRSAVEYPVGNNSTAIATGDFNGDGKLDIAVANSGENHISILAGNGDGTFKAATTVNTNGRPVALAAADLNGDGKLDLVVLSFGLMGTNTYSVLIGNGDGTFKAPMDTTLAAGGTYVAVGDFNLDGKADLAISHFNANTVSVFSGKGDGTFGSERLYLVGTNPGALVIQDVNGDGKPDIVVANGSSSVLLADPGSAGITTLLGNGDGTFQAAPSLPAGNEPAGVVAVDVNGDGKTDAVVSNQFGGELDVYLNDGKGGFGQPRRIAVTGLNGNTTSAFGIAAADFNGDGKIDVALADGINQDVTVLAGNGDGDFNPLTSVAMPAGAVSLTAADFNGDG